MLQYVWSCRISFWTLGADVMQFSLAKLGTLQVWTLTRRNWKNRRKSTYLGWLPRKTVLMEVRIVMYIHTVVAISQQICHFNWCLSGHTIAGPWQRPCRCRRWSGNFIVYLNFMNADRVLLFLLFTWILWTPIACFYSIRLLPSDRIQKPVVTYDVVSCYRKTVGPTLFAVLPNVLCQVHKFHH
jgi:hypothetical protein